MVERRGIHQIDSVKTATSVVNDFDDMEDDSVLEAIHQETSIRTAQLGIKHTSGPQADTVPSTISSRKSQDTRRELQGTTTSYKNYPLNMSSSNIIDHHIDIVNNSESLIIERVKRKAAVAQKLQHKV